MVSAGKRVKTELRKCFVNYNIVVWFLFVMTVFHILPEYTEQTVSECQSTPKVQLLFFILFSSILHDLLPWLLKNDD